MTRHRVVRSAGALAFSSRISRRFSPSFMVAAGLLALFLLVTDKQSHAVTPPGSLGLTGTWVNTQSSGLIAQVSITNGFGTFRVHLYGFCPGSPCDWGSYGASRFSASVSSNTAVGFRMTISSTTDAKTIQGHLTGKGALEITTQISYAQTGTGENYEVTDEFQLQGSTGGQAPNVPSNPPALAGTWSVVKSDGGLTRVTVSESGAALQIHPYGACSPTDCDWGVQPASSFSSSPSSSIPVGFGSSINQSFASRFLQGHLVLSSTGESLLEITTQTTFATGDPRYDYELTEDFQLGGTGTPSFSMNPASNSLTITSGGQVSDAITITPVNGAWNSAVQLSCSVTGTSPSPTCSLSQPSVTPGSSAVTFTLTVKMPTVAARNVKTAPPRLYATLAPFALGIALFAGTGQIRKRWVSLFMPVLLAALCLLLFGCGGGATSNSAVAQQTGGPFTVNVVASSGNIQLGTQIVVTMQ